MVLGHTDLAGLPRWVSGKESTCQCRRPGFNPWIEKNPWRMATYSSILSWKIPRTKEPGRLQSMGLQRIGDDLATECMHTHTHAHTHAHTHPHGHTHTRTRTHAHTHAHAHTHGLSCSMACRLFLDQGSNPSAALADRFLITGPPGTPLCFYVNITTPCTVHLNWHPQSLSCVRLFVTPWHL